MSLLVLILLILLICGGLPPLQLHEFGPAPMSAGAILLVILLVLLLTGRV